MPGEGVSGQGSMVTEKKCVAPPINKTWIRHCTGLRRLLTLCEIELGNLDTHINVNKCKCIRLGREFNARYADLISIHGGTVTMGH
jgi:hypothetical protein